MGEGERGQGRGPKTLVPFTFKFRNNRLADVMGEFPESPERKMNRVFT